MRNRSCTLVVYGLATALGALSAGCSTPSITAVDLDHPEAADGMPFYLPKPYLIVSKNIRFIPTPTIGLTQTGPIPNSFQGSGGGDASGTPSQKASGQAGDTSKPGSSAAGLPGGQSGSNAGGAGAGATKPTTVAPQAADVSDTAAGEQDGSGKLKPAAAGANGSGSNTTSGKTGGTSDGSNTQVLGPASIAVVPAAAIPDGLTPDVFYTYQIVYLPDLTHRYGLRVKGGSGELRSTLNLVNGWMFTGPGPLYLRDSFTGEKISAGGNAASGLLDSASKFVTSIAGGPTTAAVKAVSAAAPKAKVVGGAGAPIGAPQVIAGYAELHVFEPKIEIAASGDKTITWVEVPNFKVSLDREVYGLTGSGGAAGAGAEQAGTVSQVVERLKGLSLDDGLHGGKFTVTDASFDPTTHQANVTLGTNGQKMDRTYDEASLKEKFTAKICGAVAEVTNSTACLAVVDDSAVSTALKPAAKPKR